MRTGAQFYTIKDYCKTLDGLLESLARVADIGYTTVQLSGVCAYDPEWMAQELKKNGLTCVLTHTKGPRMIEAPEQVCRDHKIFGCRNIGLSSMPNFDFSEESYQNFVNSYHKVAEIFVQEGCKLYFHNHADTFARLPDGKQLFERILEDFSPELLNITLDTYWVQFAGGDPAAWLRKLAGRVECIHLKDMCMVGKEQHMAPVGWGNMNFDAILSAAEDAGSQYLLVEQDLCYGEDPFVCLKKSYDYLKSVGLQ